MPSGAKKRKAAKKKKEQEAYSSNSNNSSSTVNNNNNKTSSTKGNDDPKSQDERDSDGGEVGSPVSQDQYKPKQPFDDGNEGSENKSPQSIQSPENEQTERVTRDAEGSQKVGLKNDSVDKIEMELNSRQDALGDDVMIEHIESTKESHGEDASSSSSSSSDDGSQTPEKIRKHEKVADPFSEEVEKIAENEKQVKGSDGSAIVENVTDIGVITPVVPISEDLVDLETVEVIELGFEGNEDKLLPAFVETTEVSQALVVPEKKEDNAVTMLDEKLGASVSNVYGNEGKKLTSSDACTAEISQDAENIKASETLNGTVIRNEDEILEVSAPCVEPSDRPENARYSETCECTESENQPPAASAPTVTQRTSWLSCCGLFDVFTGSSR